VTALMAPARSGLVVLVVVSEREREIEYGGDVYTGNWENGFMVGNGSYEYPGILRYYGTFVKT